jgi:hypothetical protein
MPDAHGSTLRRRVASRRRAMLIRARSHLLRSATTAKRSATPTPLEPHAHAWPQYTAGDADGTGQGRDG